MKNRNLFSVLEYLHQFEYYESGAVIQAQYAREFFAITVSHNL